MGPSKALTPDEINARLVAAISERDETERQIEALEAAFHEATTAPQVDELAVSRAWKRLIETRQKKDRCEERIRGLEAMTVEAARRASRELDAEKLVIMEGLLKQRLALCGELEEWTRNGAKLVKRIRQLNVQILEMRPDSRRGHVYDTFTSHGLQHFAGLRLYGYSDGAWRPRSVGMESPYTAIHGDGRNKQPTLVERAARENAQVLAECSPRDEPPPAA